MGERTSACLAYGSTPFILAVMMRCTSRRRAGRRDGAAEQPAFPVEGDAAHMLVDPLGPDAAILACDATKQWPMRDADEPHPSLQHGDREVAGRAPRPISTSHQPVLPTIVSSWPPLPDASEAFGAAVSPATPDGRKISIQPVPSSFWFGLQSRPMISVRRNPPVKPMARTALPRSPRRPFFSTASMARSSSATIASFWIDGGRGRGEWRPAAPGVHAGGQIEPDGPRGRAQGDEALPTQPAGKGAPNGLIGADGVYRRARRGEGGAVRGRGVGIGQIAILLPGSRLPSAVGTRDIRRLGTRASGEIASKAPEIRCLRSRPIS